MPSTAQTEKLRLLTPLVGLLLLALLAVFSWSSWRSERADQLLQLRTVAELTEKAVDQYFVQKQRALAVLAADVMAGAGLTDLVRVQALLARFGALHEELLAVSLVRLDGQFLATSSSTKLVGLPSAADRVDYPQVLAGLRPEVPMELGRPLLGPVTKQWILPLRYSVRDAAGQPAAFIVASVPIEMIQKFWSSTPVVEHASIALLRDDAYLINRHPLPAGLREDVVYGQPRGGAVVQHLRQQGFPATGQVQGQAVVGNEIFVSVFVRLRHYPVTLVVGMPATQLLQAWWQRRQVWLLLGWGLALCGLFALHTLIRRELAWKAERLAAEARLQASEALLERTGEVAQVGGWSVDLASQRVTWSSHTYRIHEVDHSHLPTVENGIAFYAPQARPVIEAAIGQAVAGGDGWDLELPFITARGRAIWVRALGEVERVAGRPVRLVGAFQDVTEYRQRRIDMLREQALRKQAEEQAQQLEGLLLERTRMLDVLAHEVRQPLHNASAALQSASAVLRAVAQPAAVSRLERASAVLSQVAVSIDNTLAVASLLARPDRIQLADTDIDTLVALAVADCPLEQRGRILVQRLTPMRTVQVDMSLVRLALRNLLANALRHSLPTQTVTLRISDAEEPLALLMDVIDPGPGVDIALLENLFERGARGSGSPGHGLGLYIVRRVMELHHGSATLQHNTAGRVVFRLAFEQHADD